jgi:hypothetical protein
MAARRGGVGRGLRGPSRDQLDAGADGVILHDSSPAELQPVVDAYRRVRPVGRFEDRPANPAG